MKKFSFSFEDVLIEQTDNGIFVNDHLFLAACIEKITCYCHFTSYSHYTQIYKIELTTLNSYFPDIPLVLEYDRKQPEDFFKKLKSNKLKSDFPNQDSIIIWNELVTRKEVGLRFPPPVLSSDNCGWIIFKNNLFYMTSKFAISKNGLIYEYHCNNPDAYIVYDKEISPKTAFRETMKLLSGTFNEKKPREATHISFEETIPIFVTQILSLLLPIIHRKHLYNVPGLFLSGPTSTGKTQLALKLGMLFGNPATNEIRNVMILQGNIREFNRRQKGFSDTTFLLDDARIPKSQNLSRSITDVMEFCGRISFSKSDTRITPIITGEPKIFNGQLESLKSRFIEIFLPLTQEKALYRNLLIEQLNENSKYLKTCLVYFIQFICYIAKSSIIDTIIKHAKEEFYQSFRKNYLRNQDNLLMHYIGFSLFLYYGKVFCNMEAVGAYKKQYKETLRYIDIYQSVETEDGQVCLFICLLSNLIKNRKLKIFMPKTYTYEELYPDEHDNEIKQENSREFTYGHYAVIDKNSKFYGIYIIPHYCIPGCEKKPAFSPILLVNRQQLFHLISQENEISSHPYIHKSLYLNERSLIRLLGEKGILYTEERSGKEAGLKNYCFKYPYWTGKGICLESTIAFNTNNLYISKFNRDILNLPKPRLSPASLYSKQKSPYSRKEMEEFCKGIRPFL